MFGLGMPEILLILAIALIVIGPQKLPELAKTLGRAMGEFKKAAQDFKKTMDVESSVKNIHKPVEPLKATLKEAVMPEEEAENIKSSTEEKAPDKASTDRSIRADKTPPATDSENNA